MTKEELIERLKKLRELSDEDTEVAHCDADDALIEYIGDEEIAEAFDNIHKWYA
jgi:hypothetical protein